MIEIDGDDIKLKITSAKLTFLQTFPIDEIDNWAVRSICKKYKTNSTALLDCMVSLNKHEDYLYNWYQNNHMCNVFYNRE